MNTNQLFIFLFLSLIFFIFCDYITTYYAILKFGAIELNPLYSLCDGFRNFMILKTVFTVIALFLTFLMRNVFRDSLILSLIILNIIYGLVILSNLYQLTHEIF